MTPCCIVDICVLLLSHSHVELGNLLAAKQCGWVTVLVGTTAPHPGIDFCIAEVHDLRSVLPQLWQ